MSLLLPTTSATSDVKTARDVVSSKSATSLCARILHKVRSVSRPLLPFHMQSENLVPDTAGVWQTCTTLAQQLAAYVTQTYQLALVNRTPYCSFLTAFILPFLSATIFAALHYFLSVNESLWNEISTHYDKNGDARFDMEELLAVFNISTSAACHSESVCIPREQALQWIAGTDDEHDGIDREELLQMFQQLPPFFLPAKSVIRLRRLVSISQYLRLGQLCALLLSVLLVVLLIFWFRQQIFDRRAEMGKRWQNAKNAIKRNIQLEQVKRKALQAQQEVADTKQRLIRADREMARLNEQRRHAAKEQQKAEEELRARERLLSALVDPMEESITGPMRWAQFLYASPLVLSSASGPVPLDDLNVKDEYKLLQEALSKSGIDGLQLQADLATPKKLVELLLSDVPRLCLHLSCHGTDDCLCLEDEIGCAVAFSTEALRKCIAKKPRSTTLEVAVLMCCSSQKFGKALVEAGFRHVVCANGKLLDRTARFFTETFWTKLSNPEVSVEEAFHAALMVLQASADDVSSDAVKIVLLPSDPQEAPLLRAASTPQFLQRRHSVKPELSSINSELEDFIGREKVPCQILACFRGGRRVVCLHGGEGLGKTATLSFLARFASSQGRLFSDGVFYDPACISRDRTSEPLVWQWLEAVWRKLGESVWEQERAGLHPSCSSQQLRERLCAEFIELQRRRREQPQSTSTAASGLLLVVDDADMLTLDEMSLISEILEKTQISVLLTAKKSWNQDIGVYKVVDVPLYKLDDQSSAKLFLKRVRRPLHQKDFEQFEHQAAGVSRDAAKSALAAALVHPINAPVQALQQHPLIQLLSGNPGKIRKAAELVVDKGPSLCELHNILMHKNAHLVDQCKNILQSVSAPSIVKK